LQWERKDDASSPCVSRLAIIAFNEKGYARDYDACYHDHFFSNHRCPSGLPGENFNKKPNNAKKRAAKGQTDCLKARKKAKLYLRYCHCFVTKISKLQEYQKKIFKIKIKSCLALYWSTDLL